MTEERLAYLFEKYTTKTCSYEELQEWFSYVKDPEARLIIERLAANKWADDSESDRSVNIDWDSMFNRIVTNDDSLIVNQTGYRIKRIKRVWMIAAAILVMLTGTVSILFFDGGENKAAIAKLPVAANAENDVAPGKTGAILTLSNGEQVVLDSAENGILAQQGGVEVLKENGQLNYQGMGTAEVVNNTMSTPNGRQYSLVLADGTKVWLNAASSITFPTAFIGNDRKVTVTGEAYFEVAHNPAKPFYVNANGLELVVLGTTFNVNAYEDERSAKTTLLEGKLMVKKGEKSVILSPGQQATSSNRSANGIIKVNAVDVDGIVAWKDGFFNFDHSDLPKILREFSRWYDIEIQYKGPVSKKEFFGIVNRNSSLVSVLKALRAGNSNSNTFKVEGKKLIVQ